MEKSAHLIHTKWLMAFMLFLLHSCATGKKQAATGDTELAGATRVTVVDYRDLDGCEFLLETADGSKLQPVNLVDELRVAGVKIDITFKYIQRPGICMAGRMIEITRYRKVSP